MKLLLTSGGLSNVSIQKAFRQLTGKSPQDTKVGFVPTAASAEGGNKDWLIQDLTKLRVAGFGWIDIVDFSAAGVNWRSRLKAVDVIYVSGGNTFHLLDQARKAGFDKWIIEALKHKVYVGSSAGSILATPTIAVAGLADHNLPRLKDLEGLGLVNFEFIPHVPEFIDPNSAEQYGKTTKRAVYVVDDQTAIKVEDDDTTVISEGKWSVLNSL